MFKKAFIITILPFISSCGMIWGGINYSTALVQSQMSSYGYTSSPFSTQPLFTMAELGSGAPNNAISDLITLSAFSDPYCKIPAPGTFVANPVYVNGGQGQFSGVTYTDSSHLEENIYLSAYGTNSKLSICTTPVYVRQHFNAGVGVVIDGAPGIAGGAGAGESDHGTGLLIDAKGRYVISGYSVNAAGGVEAAVWRYNPDGTLDSTFGTGGVTVFGSTGVAGAAGGSENDKPGGEFFSGQDAQFDSQGRQVFAGFSVNAASGVETALWRFTGNGVIDASFGAGVGAIHGGAPGFAGAIGGSQFDDIIAFKIDTSGNYVGAGLSRNAANAFEMGLWRYTSAGVLDASFNGTGYVLSGLAGLAGAVGANVRDYAFSLIIDAQGRYVIAGSSKNAAGGNQMAIWRYLPSGLLDTTFAGTGTVLSSTTGAAGAIGASESDQGFDIQIDSRGRYVIAGQSVNPGGGTEVAIWRYNSSGAIDTSFNGTGSTHWGPTGVTGTTGAAENDYDNVIGQLAIDGSGRYLVAAQALDTHGGAQGYILRYNADGSKDFTFSSGTAVVLTGNPGPAGGSGAILDAIRSLTIDSQGRYLGVGRSSNNVGGRELVIWRFLNTGLLDQ